MADEKTQKQESKSLDARCDNHPDRSGTRFTCGGAVDITLCEECTPPWFKDEDKA